MLKNSSDTPLSYGSDFAKMDAHVIQPEEYDELPEWTDEMFATADLYHGEKLIRRGRPVSASKKILTTLRLDTDVVERFRATGKGWQSRINEVLRQAQIPAK
jgi:uncharacterized protein (DUF4415 family)